MEDFWKQTSNLYANDADFKAAVLKDNEVVAVVGALLGGMSFAGLLVSVDKTASSEARWIYLASMVVAVASALSSSLNAMRTVLLINSAPASCTLQLMQALERHCFRRVFYPFRLANISSAALFTASVAWVACAYSKNETAVCAGMMGFAFFLVQSENHSHFVVRHELVEANQAAQSKQVTNPLQADETKVL